jgi:hypothetical protein
MTTAVALAAMSFAAAPASGQARPAAASADSATRKGSAPRTSWGTPDLQGTWSTATVTPLERPAGAGEFLTPAEVADIERRAQQAATDEARGDDRARDVAGAYNDFWWDRGTKVGGNRRTSLIIDPPDGRIPALTPAARKYADSPEAKRIQDTRRGSFPAASWEDTDLWDRCLTRGLPMLPGPYNNNFQIFQTQDYVVVLHEMIHDARMIPLGNGPHLDSRVSQWFGSARGRWEGDTLVVETRNFSPKQELPFEPRTSAAGLHLTERFTRLDDGTLNYEFTVNDPAIYSRPWTAAIPMRKSDGQVFEYACHEGNYGIVGILAGSRAIEKAAADAARKGSR